MAWKTGVLISRLQVERLPIPYSWSNGAAGEDLFAAAAGEYILTVLDASGCPISSQSIDIPEPDRIDIQVSEIDPIGCDQDGEGKIEIDD